MMKTKAMVFRKYLFSGGKTKKMFRIAPANG